jgi:MerR family transcriptional regulator, copper efflux regulator
MTDSTTPDTTHALLQIGEVADRVGLSLRTIRYYEEQRLVVPETRTEGGFRLYRHHHIERLLQIKKMKPLGFSLEDMATMLSAQAVLQDPTAAPAEHQTARDTIARFADRVDEQITKTRDMLQQSEEFARSLRAQT